MSSTTNISSATTHERDIPGLADQAVFSKAEACYTELSFCLPTSLAFAKRLTWEQTPWIGSTVNQKSANPINEADSHTIANYLSTHLSHTVTVEAVQNALLFGSTYTPSSSSFSSSSQPSSSHLSTTLHLFIIFPHAHGPPPSHAPSFLSPWHDQIVKPAFDRAWKDSALTPIHGAEPDGQTRILAPTGTHTAHDALSAKGFLERLRNGNPTAASATRADWPAWTADNWGLGAEGRYSGTRAKILDEAWEAIFGMLKGHPDLPEYQDPILLAVCRARIYVAEGLSAQGKVGCVTQEWDKVIDARFVKEGSFKVVFQSVVGMGRDEGRAEGGEEKGVWIGDAEGRNFKRVVKEENDGMRGGDQGGEGHRDKRAKTAGDGETVG
ncbi:Nn.00g022160.m01.CDS01 [Neocucurbitaria sp. VM-36]